jgi:hypothetical protein
MITKLLPERKAQFLAALRSGDYEQGTHSLRPGVAIGDEKWCCLGVASDLFVKAGLGEWEGGYCNIFGGSREGAIMPIEVGKWLTGSPLSTLQVRVTDEILKRPAFDDYLRTDTVAVDTLNDNGFSFEEIADLIEEQL